VTRTDPVPPPEQPTTERLEGVFDSIEAVAHGQGAMAAAENGLGDRRESYVTNAATRNLLKGLVREGRAALAEARAAERRAVVERIKREVPDDWTPWESDKADEAFGYNDALNRVRSILDAVATDTPGEPER
jgi:hypothetical protein